MIQLKLLTATANTPARHSHEAAGCDLHADTEGIIQPGTGSLVKTGIAISVPLNHVGVIYGRSGLANKNWIEVDSGCVHPKDSGEVEMYLFNNSEVPFEYKRGDRIAQIVFLETGCEIVVDY